MAHRRASTKVIIVGGGGTMGSSTALHLIRAGYDPLNITVLDVYPIPSAQSAGYDLNKIMSIRLRNEADLQLSLEALDMWQHDALFKPFFHKVGMVSHDIVSVTLHAYMLLDGLLIIERRDCKSSKEAPISRQCEYRAGEDKYFVGK